MEHVSFDAPSEYSITIQGIISSSLFENLRHPGVLVHSQPNVGTTELQISVKDQAHLLSVLNSIYDARLVIIGINYRGNKPKN